MTVSVPVTGLLPNALYVYRVVATSSRGTTDGDTASFTTPVAQVQFSGTTYTANVTDGTARIVLRRGGDVSGTFTVVTSSPGGSGIDAFRHTTTFCAEPNERGLDRADSKQRPAEPA